MPSSARDGQMLENNTAVASIVNGSQEMRRTGTQTPSVAGFRATTNILVVTSIAHVIIAPLIAITRNCFKQRIKDNSITVFTKPMATARQRSRDPRQSVSVEIILSRSSDCWRRPPMRSSASPLKASSVSLCLYQEYRVSIKY